MKGKREDWIDVLREAATSGRDEKLPEGMWDRISSSLDAQQKKPAGNKRRLYVWAASVAAAAAVIALGIFTMRTTVDDIRDGVTEPPVISAHTVTPDKETPVEPDGQTPAVTTGTAASVRPPYVAEAKKTRIKNIAVVPQDTLPKAQIAKEEPKDAGITDAGAGQAKGKAPESEGKQEAGTSPSGSFGLFPDQLPEQFTDRKPSRRKMMLALSANGASSGVDNSSIEPMYASVAPSSPSLSNLVPDKDGLMTEGTPPRPYINTQRDYDKYSYRHRQPLTFALSFDLDVGHNLFVGAGVSYTRLLSKVTHMGGGGEFNQLIQYVGIPVTFKWAFLDTRYFMMYAGVELQPEFCVGAKFDGNKADIRTMQLSAHAAVGAQVNLGKHIGIYAEPKLSHYFLDTEMKTIRKTKGVNFNLQFGLRFTY